MDPQITIDLTSVIEPLGNLIFSNRASGTALEVFFNASKYHMGLMHSQLLRDLIKIIDAMKCTMFLNDRSMTCLIQKVQVTFIQHLVGHIQSRITLNCQQFVKTSQKPNVNNFISQIKPTTWVPCNIFTEDICTPSKYDK